MGILKEAESCVKDLGLEGLLSLLSLSLVHRFFLWILNNLADWLACWKLCTLYACLYVCLCVWCLVDLYANCVYKGTNANSG